MKTLLSCLSSFIASPTAGVGKYARDKISTPPRSYKLLNLGAFLLLCGGVLATALAQDKDRLTIDTPAHIRTVQNNGDGALLTLRANNIQVRADWSVTPKASFFINDRGRLYFIDGLSEPTNIAVTVMVEDKFTDLNDAYTDLTAQAVINMTLMPGVSLPRTIFVLGGYAGSSGRRNDVRKSSDGQNWSTVGNLWAGINGHQVVVHHGTIYGLGGFDGNLKNDVWASADGGTWTMLGTAAWSPRNNHQAVVHSSVIYVLGGSDGTKATNDVWASTNGISWSAITLSANWSERQFHQAVSHQGRLYVMGGTPDTISRLNDVWSSTDGSIWSQDTDADNGAEWPDRFGHQSVIHQGKIYVLGGNAFNEARANDVWSSVDGQTWLAVTSVAGWSRRWGHQAVSYNNRLYVLGGNDKNGYQDDVWSSEDGDMWTREKNNAWSSRSLFQAIVFP